MMIDADSMKKPSTISIASIITTMAKGVRFEPSITARVSAEVAPVKARICEKVPEQQMMKRIIAENFSDSMKAAKKLASVRQR